MIDQIAAVSLVIIDRLSTIMGDVTTMIVPGHHVMPLHDVVTDALAPVRIALRSSARGVLLDKLVEVQRNGL
jgi:hypothetical protein